MIRIIGLTLLAAVAMGLYDPAADAAIPYDGYTRSLGYGDVHSINGYVYMDSIDGYDLESGPFKEPQDLFAADDGTLYVADTGNNRIVRLTRDRRVLGVIGDNEGPGMLNEPKGVFVKKDGLVYVADTKNQRIAVFGAKGDYVKSFPAPKSRLLGETFTYSPSKVIVDKRDYMLVISEGNTQGLIQIDAKGEFKGFFGANHIGFSWERLFVKMVATEEQKSQLAVQKPMEFSNVAQDADGFVYTTTLATETNQIKRLSPVGVDTLNPGSEVRYGSRFEAGPFQMPSFVGISVSPEGFITALDLQSSKVFQYDKLGNLLFAFGGMGEQNGLFKTPATVAQLQEGVIAVVDKGRSRIDFFRTTPFADLVHEASALYVEGRYEEAQQMWNEVLKLNGNFAMAYHAIGKALYKAERYEEAMRYFKLAKVKGDYSTAFREYRKQYTREHFAWIALIAIALLAALRFGLPRLVRGLKKLADARGGDRDLEAAGPAVPAAGKGESV
ncbi:hypothetical protein [Paenibacillus spongiae]|uniref:SMP-30/Gluconolactonase/LRE-like region domain-containing protein n=1 Tax=Paenibacillus spongiae TaxID=2909671 RepID=A0ABY5SM76_9BACL|nr:hypothetical protein [Paenibacillus spongiae]UVI33775.1 hypothetical protein L1F29_27570 [Paenibacillus spongiae]